LLKAKGSPDVQKNIDVEENSSESMVSFYHMPLWHMHIHHKTAFFCLVLLLQAEAGCFFWHRLCYAAVQPRYPISALMLARGEWELVHNSHDLKNDLLQNWQRAEGCPVSIYL
jgi:hypothetical protein